VLVRRKAPALARGLAFENGGFERHQLIVDEAMHQILEHTVFFG
jgi:hypothetical protein